MGAELYFPYITIHSVSDENSECHPQRVMVNLGVVVTLVSQLLQYHMHGVF